MSFRPHTQRVIAWLCLVIVTIVALVPAAGAVVCLGHDGHVGFGVGGFGVADKTETCPCEHAHEFLQGESAESEAVSDSHPLCVDLAIDAPDVVKELGFSWTAPKAPCDVPDDDGLSTSTSDWGFADGAGRHCVATGVCWARAESVPRSRQQLEHMRVVVLLI